MRSLSIIVSVILVSSLSHAGPRVAFQKTNLPSTQSVRFLQSDASDSVAIPTNGNCYVRFAQAGGDDVAIYAVTDSTSAASSGTLLTTFTASTSPAYPPFQFKPSTLYIKAKATDSTTGGSVLTIDCAADAGLGGGAGAASATTGSAPESGSGFPATFPFVMG